VNAEQQTAGNIDTIVPSLILGYIENRAVSSKLVIPRKRGRPATGRDPLIAFRLPPESIAAIDAWAAQQPDGPSRSEALRRLIDLGMKASLPRGKKR
jgi:hypothetical protein